MSRLISSPHSSASGKNHTLLCVISPVSETPVHIQERSWGTQPYLWPGPALSMQFSSTHLLTVARCPHLLQSQATVEMSSPSNTSSVRPAATQLVAVRVHPMRDPCLGWAGARRRHDRTWCPLGKLAAGSFPSPGPREVRKVFSHHTVKYPQGHSCSCHLESIRLGKPKCLQQLEREPRLQFSIQGQTNSAGNMFSFGCPNRKC